MNPRQMIITITGPQGIGKTRLAEALAEILRVGGRQVAHNTGDQPRTRFNRQYSTYDVILHTGNQ